MWDAHSTCVSSTSGTIGLSLIVKGERRVSRRTIVSCLCAGLLIFTGVAWPGVAQAATGAVTISTNTTWSDPAQDYTYDTITVAQGAKLTIGPGVTVTLTGNGGGIRLRGTLDIRGTSQARSTLTCSPSRFGMQVFDALTPRRQSRWTTSRWRTASAGGQCQPLCPTRCFCPVSVNRASRAWACSAE